MHIEDLRIALFGYICAIQNSDRFVLRFDDIKKNGDAEEKHKDILNMLDIFGIKHDDIYYQSNNIKYHLQFASTLLDKKRAFICFCTPKELEAKREVAKQQNRPYRYDGTCENLSSDYILNCKKPFVIRMKKSNSNLSIKDTLKGDFTFETDDMDSFVIMDTNKYPTRNFSSAIDDMLQGITHIIENEKHFSDAPKHEHIRKSLDYDAQITYTHLPTITGTKYSIKDLLNLGYMPEAIVNYLLLISSKTPKEIFTLSETIEWFDINSLIKSTIKFDIDKLGHINQEHIKLLSDDELAKRLGYSGKGIGKLAKLYAKKYVNTLKIKQKIDSIFSPKNRDGKIGIDLEKLKIIAQKAPKFDRFDDFKNHLLGKSGLKGEDFQKSLRVLLTNSEDETDMEHLYPLIKNYIKEVVK